MEKAKIGVSVGALAAMVYFSGICGGLLVAAILTGYILIAESNLWLRPHFPFHSFDISCIFPPSFVYNFMNE